MNGLPVRQHRLTRAGVLLGPDTATLSALAVKPGDTLEFGLRFGYTVRGLPVHLLLMFCDLIPFSLSGQANYKEAELYSAAFKATLSALNEQIDNSSATSVEIAAMRSTSTQTSPFSSPPNSRLCSCVQHSLVE